MTSQWCPKVHGLYIATGTRASNFGKHFAKFRSSQFSDLGCINSIFLIDVLWHYLQLLYHSSLLALVMRLLLGGSDVRIFWTRCWGNDDLQSHAEEGV